MSSLLKLSTPDTYQALSEQYYNQRMLEVAKLTADKGMVYVSRFFTYFGPPALPCGLFAALCPKSITDFLAEYGSNHGPGSRGWMHNVLRSFLRFAYRAGQLRSDLTLFAPTIHVRRMGKVLRSVPPECIKTLLSSLECGPAPALRDKAIVCLLEGYGVRSVQVRNLRFEDINWPEKTIHFRAAKGGRPVDQFLTTRVGNALAAYISRERPKSSHKEVFLTSREPFVPFSRSDQISWILTKRFRKARITLPEGVSYGSHGFRHTFASSLYGKAPFKDIVVELIKHYLSIRGLENIEFDHLFLNKNKKPITRFGIGRVVEKYVKKRQPSANH